MVMKSQKEAFSSRYIHIRIELLKSPHCWNSRECWDDVSTIISCLLTPSSIIMCDTTSQADSTAQDTGHRKHSLSSTLVLMGAGRSSKVGGGGD